MRIDVHAHYWTQVLSACPQLPSAEDAGKAVNAARFVNDQYAGLAGRYRDRFAAFAALPMAHRMAP